MYAYAVARAGDDGPIAHAIVRLFRSSRGDLSMPAPSDDRLPAARGTLSR
jgi:hypothetical protein